jgi:taurine dioxygenase/alpha-ketoglutarate-dependent 2,4-dichlorophenoxyacetate dioxygenase
MAPDESHSETAQDFEIRPLGPALGAEIVGLDAGRPFDAATLARVREAFDRHHVLCFRDQHLSDATLVAFSRQFGPLEAFPEKDKTKGRVEVYHVANVSPEGEHLPDDDQRVIFQRNNARWHTDSSYRYVPSLASILYGLEVPPEGAQGGETDFSNMFAAYDALDDDMKRRLAPLHMVHYYECIRRLEPAMPPTTAEERDAVPPVSQPLIRVHPERGNRRSLFFTTNTGREISGLTLAEGQALHDWLRTWIERPEFCYRHRWRQGDLVMWDNRCLLHRAVAYDYTAFRRVLRRTTVAGAGPVLGPYSQAVREAAE